MNQKLEHIQDKFLNNIGRMSDDFGLNGFVAKLYAILYLRASPLSLDELAQALGVTKGNVSINIRELENWGAVKRVWVKGSRKDYYEADLDVKKVIIHKLRSSIQKRLSEISLMVEDFNKSLGQMEGELVEEEKKAISGYLERLKKIEELKDFIQGALSLADKVF